MSVELCPLCRCPSPHVGQTCGTCHAVLHRSCVRTHGPCHGALPARRPAPDHGEFNPAPSGVDWGARWQWLIAGYALGGLSGLIWGLAASAPKERLGLYAVSVLLSFGVAASLLSALRAGEFEAGEHAGDDGICPFGEEFVVSQKDDPAFFEFLTVLLTLAAVGLALLAAGALWVGLP